MSLNSANPLEMNLFQFDSFSRFAHIRHGISTRQAPRKPIWNDAQPENENDYKLGGSNIDVPDDIIMRRRAEFLAACGGDWQAQAGNMTSGKQVHSANVALVGRSAYGAWRTWRNSLPATDALITNLPGVPLLTGHADCPPVLLHDPVKRAIGLVHSGWRGTVARIAREAVGRMGEAFGSNPAHIIAGIGPSIGPCCYEVDEPVIREVEEAFGSTLAEKFLPVHENGSHAFDLWEAIHYTLLEAGLTPNHIEMSSLCSLCHNDIFFSYRAAPADQKGKQGNYCALIMLA